MERSFNSSLLNKSALSSRSHIGLSAKRPLSQSFRKSSRFSVSAKSTQSVQIILSSAYNHVERFGQALPVLISEALTFADKNTVVSARIATNGYSWVVCGRRLFIWQYRQSPIQSDAPHKRSTLLNQCLELQLPQSDLAHRAELVSVFVNEGSKAPSCIAVSPAGVIRYWPAIVHEEMSIEENVKLQGQECDSLVDVEGLGCILATTSCTVLLIQPVLTGGRQTLHHHTLKVPSGWLGGISKRMSSLFFGPISSDSSTETGVVRVLSIPRNSFSWTCYVLADRSLQKWNLSKDSPEEVVFVTELGPMIRDGFRSVLWENCDQSEIDVWLLDIQADKDNIIVLAAAVNAPVLPRIHYAMLCLQTNTNEPPTNFKDFLLLKFTDLYQPDNISDLLSYRFLLAGTSAYLYNQRCITVIKPNEEPDTLEFNTPEDTLLAGLICVNTPIFFSRNNGLVAISNNDMVGDLNLSVTGPSTPIETSFNESLVVNNLTIYNMDPEEVSNSYKDALGQLKAAFIYHVKNQEAASKELIDELFDPDTLKLSGIDSVLDKIVLMLCNDMLDDVPVGDPRWNKELPMGLGSSYSMQILHQLEDKQKALSLFIRFLKSSGLWNQLSASTVRNNTVATVRALMEYPEKITASIVLKGRPKSSAVLDKAIEKFVEDLESTPKNGLTNQDLFYRLTTKVHTGLQELVFYCEDMSHSDADPTKIVEVITDVNDIFLGVIKEVLKYRKQNAETFKVPEAILAIAPELLPWTAASGSDGLFDALSQLHFLTYNYGVLLIHNERTREELMDYLVITTDILLDGRKSHIESVKGLPQEEILFKQYCADRKKYMKPFVQEKDWERAAKLAEKYLDFETLVVLCEATDNQFRLDEYLERFDENGFSEYVFNWYLKENKQGKLLEKNRNLGKTQRKEKLTDFLSDQPALSWIQNIFDKKFSTAATTLHHLALNETESITRQKTMFSLCKLAKLAHSSEPDSFVKEIGERLDLISYQEEMPDYVLQEFGYDTENIRVIPPKALIGLYICKEFKEAGDLEFKKALDLLDFVEEDAREELNLKIWREALLRDSWKHTNLDSPIEILQNKLFFKLIDLAISLNAEALQLLPALDTLLEDDTVEDLAQDTNFQFLMKTGYEHINRVHSIESFVN